MSDSTARLLSYVSSLKPGATFIVLLALYFLVSNITSQPDILLIGCLSAVLVAALAILLLPNPIFLPKQIDPVASASGQTFPVRASGQFQEVLSLAPSTQMGKRSWRFRHAEVNLVPQEHQRLLVHYHFEWGKSRVRASDLPLNRRESDWGVVLDPSTLVDIMPGQIFSNGVDWWVIRLRYKDAYQKQQVLYLTFDEPGQLKECARQLRQNGFRLVEG